jgi:outer membrane cobalamin receptor
MNMLKNIITTIFLIMGAIATPATGAYASETSLLFVGEDLAMLTIASRRAESPQSAPAIARVVTRNEIEQQGYKTLGEILSDMPGFYILPSHADSVAYMRGLPNSVLFLYDSVPLTSDATKSISPLDQELSLAHVERIEIIRGPGSVLWGPDAFAGIVNIVPRRGRDIDGLAFSAFGGTANGEGGGSVSWGKNAGLWEAFVSISAESSEPNEADYNVVKLTGPQGTPLPLDERLGSGSVDQSKYLEAVINFSWQDWLRLSGRWSDVRKKYVLEDNSADLRWPAERDAPLGYLRLELEKKFTSSALRLSSYYSTIDKQQQELDFPQLDQHSRLSYSELIFDKELWGANGLLTLGASYRYNQIDGVGLTKAYLPDFFDQSGSAYFPLPQQTDFSTSLFDVFGQIKRQWNHFDAWFGIRLTNHSDYDIEARPNLGMIWSPSSAWNLKLLYGTSYRTPYARQLAGRDDLQLEEIENISASLTWKASPALRFAVTTFHDQENNHTAQDPYYGGLSDPTSQKIYGVELESAWRVTPSLKLQANATAFTCEGDDETFTYYAYIFEDGEWVLSPWTSWSMPSETGPAAMANVGLQWQLTSTINLSLSAKYEHSWEFWYANGEKQHRVPGRIQVNSALTFKEVGPGLDLGLSLTNLTGSTVDTKGAYGPVESPPFGAFITLTLKK